MANEKRGPKRKSVFAYTPNVYTPDGGRVSLSSKEARHEYARLRSLAMRRLKQFEGTEYTDTKIYRMMRDLPKSSDIADKNIYHALTDVYYIIKSPASTITGMRATTKKAVSTMLEHGYKGVTAGNIRKFGEYMKRYKAEAIARGIYTPNMAQSYFDREKEATPDEIWAEYVASQKTGAD